MRLLISVTDGIEAADAAAAGADIIDVKDPATGALGLAHPATVREARRLTPPDRPVSVALGDGPFEPRAAAWTARLLSESGAAYVKLGLRNTQVEDALATLRAVRASLPAAVGLIVAGFADCRRAGAPDPLDLPDIAAAGGAQGCLVDTAVKDGRGLLDWLTEPALRALVAACRARGLSSGLAGSLRAADLFRIAAIAPDIVGVRGAACDGDRVHGRVSRARVAALGQALRGDPAALSIPAAST